MGIEYLNAFAERALAALSQEDAPPSPPADLAPLMRGLVITPTPPVVERVEVATVEDARAMAKREMLEYASLVNPPHMLLIRIAAGTGKSHIAAGVANELAAKQRRVLWAAPRHDFIHDLRNLSAKQGYNPADIYEWRPRESDDEAKGIEANCLYVEPISDWMNRGYEAFEFCKRICGFDYIGKQCKYHAQKNRPEPIVMGVHQHMTLGHPLAENFEVVIGDESPLSTFLYKWRIPSRWILPPDMDAGEPLAEILFELRNLCEKDAVASGEELIRLLGGAHHVLRSIDGFLMDANIDKYIPRLHNSSEVDKAPYFHLPYLVPLLKREAEATAAGMEYEHRIAVRKGALLLHLRRHIKTDLPKHVIWLDATGNEHLYEELFQRPVKVIEPYVKPRGTVTQVVGRANTKGSLVKRTADEEAESYVDDVRLDQLVAQIKRIIHDNGLLRPGLITYKSVAEAIAKLNIPNLSLMHFNAARGANGMEFVDGLIVAGTPQPPLEEMAAIARMIFFTRIDRFDRTWSTQEQPYFWTAPDGTGRAYPISGFWHDPDLQAILWQHREAELIQAINRARIAIRDVPVWLLANVPIDNLRLHNVIELRDFLGAPPDANIFLWDRARRFADDAVAKNGYVTTNDFVDGLGLDARTARKYVEQLAAQAGWDYAALRLGRGRPVKAAQPQEQYSTQGIDNDFF